MGYASIFVQKISQKVLLGFDGMLHKYSFIFVQGYVVEHFLILCLYDNKIVVQK